MRAGTAARLVYAFAVVAVVVIMVAPSLATLTNMGAESFGAGTRAVYDLEYMDEKTLEDNIRNAVSGSDGCSILYGDSSLPVDSSSCAEAAKAVKSSGVQEAKVVGPDGNVLRQESISYRNPVLMGGRTGIGIDLSGISMDVRAVFASDDGKVDIRCDSDASDIEGEISIGYIVPLVVYNIAAAYGCHLGVDAKVDYTGMGRVDVSVLSEDLSYESEVTGSTVIEVRGCMVSEYGSGKVGNADIEFLNDGTNVMRLSCEGDLSDALEAGLEDGCLTVSLNGASYRMGAEMSVGLISAVDALEARK